MQQTRETARPRHWSQLKRLAKGGGWRLWESFLKMSFPSDHWQDGKIEVNANAATGAQEDEILIRPEQRDLFLGLTEGTESSTTAAIVS